MGKLLSLMIAVIIAFSGCVKTDDNIVRVKKPVIRKLELVKTIHCEDGMQMTNFMDAHGGRFVTAQVFPGFEKGLLEVRDGDLNLVKGIKISRGKGPGEFLFPAYLYLDGKHIYILDGAKNCIELYDMEGNYSDSWLIKSNVTIFKNVTSLVVNGRDFYIAPLLPSISAKFDENGKVTAEVKSSLENNDDGRMWQEHASRLAKDDQGNIYLSYTEAAYRICKYDRDFNLIWDKTIADDSTVLKPGMDMVVIGNAKQPVGVFTHSSFFWNKGKLYVFRGVGGELAAEMREGRKQIVHVPIRDLENPYIDVFDADDCSYLYRIDVPYFNTDSWAEVSIVDDKFVFLSTEGREKSKFDNSLLSAVISDK